MSDLLERLRKQITENAAAENEPPTCAVCESEMSLRDDYGDTGICDVCAQIELQTALGEIERLRAEVERLKRGEFICRKCGLRKNDDYPKGDF